MFGLVLLVAAAGIAFFIYQKYVLAAAHDPTVSDPVFNTQTPKRSSSVVNAVGDKDVKQRPPSSSARTPLETAKSPGSFTPLAVKTPKPRTPRPIQVITLGIGGDDLAPGVVQEARTPPPPPPAPVAAAVTPEPEKPKSEEPAPPPAQKSESSRELKAQAPSDATQDSGAAIDNGGPPTLAQSTQQMTQSPSNDVITARSPAPSELAAPAVEPLAAPSPAPAPIPDEQKPSEDVKTARIISDPATTPKPEAEGPPNPVAAAGIPETPTSGRETGAPVVAPAEDKPPSDEGSTQSAPPGPTDAAAALAGQEKPKKKKSKDKKRSKGSKGKKKAKSKDKDGAKKSKHKKEKKKRSKKEKSEAGEENPPPAV